MKDSRSSAVLRWFFAGLALMYAMVTLAVATGAMPPTEPNPFLDGFHRLFVPLAQLLPGAGLWPSVMDMRGMLGGGFSIPFAGVLILGAAGSGALYLAGSIRAQVRKDAATAHDEAVRERKRQELRRT